MFRMLVQSELKATDAANFQYRDGMIILNVNN